MAPSNETGTPRITEYELVNTTSQPLTIVQGGITP